MGNIIRVIKPVLVKPLLPEEQEAFKQHGCTIEPYPKGRPDLLKGYMVTFPGGTEMEEVTTIQYLMRFPDGYRPTLVYSEGWYSLYPERGPDGHLI